MCSQTCLHTAISIITLGYLGRRWRKSHDRARAHRRHSENEQGGGQGHKLGIVLARSLFFGLVVDTGASDEGLSLSVDTIKKCSADVQSTPFDSVKPRPSYTRMKYPVGQ